jgi:hypothetical protein
MLCSPLFLLYSFSCALHVPQAFRARARPLAQC